MAVAMVVCLGCGNGCKRSPAPSGAASDTPSKGEPHGSVATESLTPSATLRRIHQYRMTGQLSLIEPYLLPEQRPHIIELLQSLDQLVAASSALRAAVEAHIGPASAQAFDRPGAADSLGIFSRNVRILSETTDEDTAAVTIQVAQRVPLETVNLVRYEGRWVIREETPIPGVAEAMRGLAGVDQAMARKLAQEKMTVEELQEELGRRRAPFRRRLAEIYRQARPSP